MRLKVIVVAFPLLLSLCAAAQEPASRPARGSESNPMATPQAEQRARFTDQYKTADVRIISPGVVTNAGLVDLAMQYEKQTGKKVGIRGVGMGSIANAARTMTPPPDVVMLPFSLMGSLALDHGVAVDSFTPLGRSEMGLAVPAGAAHPDISTVEKLATVLKGAKKVMRSDPSHGSMVASVIRDQVINRPEFAGVNSPVSTHGEGGQALARGEGDMAIQAVCEILPYKQIELVGPLPRELGAWIDMATAVSSRAEHRENGLEFIKFLLRPESKSVWQAKGLERFQ